jgi:hypothetical protein
VRYINTLPANADNVEFASGLIEMMVDAGSDPRMRNNAQLTPAQLVDPRNTTLRQQLQDAIEIAQNAGDFVGPDDEAVVADEDEDVPEEYEGSDSDFDPEEFKREVERRKRAAANAAANGDAGMI